MDHSTWHVSPMLGVPNVRQAAVYYLDVLGFTLDPVNGVFQPTDNEPGGVYAIVRRSGASVHFQIRRGGLPERRRTAIERDVCVSVDDLDALHSDLQRRRALIQEPPHMAPHRIREMVVEDPNGYRLVFGENNR